MTEKTEKLSPSNPGRRSLIVGGAAVAVAPA